MRALPANPFRFVQCDNSFTFVLLGIVRHGPPTFDITESDIDNRRVDVLLYVQSVFADAVDTVGLTLDAIINETAVTMHAQEYRMKWYGKEEVAEAHARGLGKTLHSTPMKATVDDYSLNRSVAGDLPVILCS